MQTSTQPITQDLVLIGGGHSHAIALKQFGMKPMPGVRLTLITDVAHTPYSGMLPGYVAGLYNFDECHIDLRPLSQFAQARMILDRAVGLDLHSRQVFCAHRPPIAFDWLSIDIGSTPATLTVPGAQEYAIPAKPISKFLAQWDQVVQTVTQHPQQRMRIGIVGGGAGGVELALSVDAHLRRIYRAAGQPESNLEMHLFHRGSSLLPRRNRWVGQRLQQIMRDRQIQVHLQESVSEVQPQSVRCESGLTVGCDRVFWVTQASAAPWLQESGLETNDQGFVLVGDTLQSVSHPAVFAAGDVATMVNHPRPKAGVFAVRQGKPLFRNLHRILQGQVPKPFLPQKQYLILVGTGNRQAIASRGFLGLGPYGLLWRWKDHIDRKFMDQFSGLKPMSEALSRRSRQSGSAAGRIPALSYNKASSMPPMPCAGCGSKVGSTILEQALQRVQQVFPLTERDDVLVGLDAADDAAVLQVPPGQVMVQTVDYFRALIDDPFVFGQIAAHHSLSDLFAMGATPQSALAIATLPYASDYKLEETLYQLLAGATKVLSAVQAPLVGGHTATGESLVFGLTCNGLADPHHLLRKGGMKPGEVLILTKAIGTGTLFAADMRLKAKGRWIEGAIASMLRSNADAAACLRQHQATACTDVTGFGLLGHLVEMVRAAKVTIALELAAIPILDGAQATVRQGIVSSLHPQNLKAANWLQNLETAATHPLYPLLFDPQTSGGLLASVPADKAEACLQTLRNLGYADSAIVGRVLGPQTDRFPIRIKTEP